jgi:undecaprenyl pyrophosphate phosphatase UppP
MKYEQKVSWALVISISLAVVFVIAGLLIRQFAPGLAKPFMYVAAAAIAVGVIFVFRCKRDRGPITSDERDKLIEKNADMAGLGAVYLLVIVASFAPIAIFGENGTLPVTWCPALLIGAGFCQTYARSLAILIQYGRSQKGDEA